MTAMVWSLFGVNANTNTNDADGCIWTVASSDGWDSPDQRTQFDSPTGRHGQYVSNMYADGRGVVIKGMVFAPSDNAAWAAYDRITSSMPGIAGRGDIVAQEPTPKSLTVVQAAPPRASKPAGRQLTYWLSLRAEYPWKRALTPVTQAVSAGSSPTFSAAGTFPAEIEVTLTSAGTVDLTLNGQRLRFGSLPSGAVLTSGPGFTNPKRTARSSTGSNLFGLIVQPMQWPAIVPGSNSAHQAGTANLDIKYFPTYA